MQTIEGTASPADVEKLESHARQIRLAMSGIDELVTNISYVVGVPESERLAAGPERSEPTFARAGESIRVHTGPVGRYADEPRPTLTLV